MVTLSDGNSTEAKLLKLVFNRKTQTNYQGTGLVDLNNNTSSIVTILSLL